MLFHLPSWWDFIYKTNKKFKKTQFHVYFRNSVIFCQRRVCTRKPNMTQGCSLLLKSRDVLNFILSYLAY